MQPARLGLFRTLAYSLKVKMFLPPRWRGLIIAGTTAMGVEYLSRRLLHRGYRPTPTPMEQSMVPTFKRTREDKAWDTDPKFYRVYVLGKKAELPAQYEAADVVIREKHRGDTARLLEYLDYLLKE